MATLAAVRRPHWCSRSMPCTSSNSSKCFTSPGFTEAFCLASAHCSTTHSQPTGRIRQQWLQSISKAVQSVARHLDVKLSQAKNPVHCCSHVSGTVIQVLAKTSTFMAPCLVYARPYAHVRQQVSMEDRQILSMALLDALMSTNNADL